MVVVVFGDDDPCKDIVGMRRVTFGFFSFSNCGLSCARFLFVILCDRFLPGIILSTATKSEAGGGALNFPFLAPIF